MESDGLELTSFRSTSRSFDLSLYHIEAKLALRQTTSSLQGPRQPTKTILEYMRDRDKRHDLSEVPGPSQDPHMSRTRWREWGNVKTRADHPELSTRGARGSHVQRKEN